jgi:hypothetical protein
VVKITAVCAYVLGLLLFIMGMVTATESYYWWFLVGGWTAWLVGTSATIRIVWEAWED